MRAHRHAEKQGRIVALDRTRRCWARLQHVLRFKTDDACPPIWRRSARHRPHRQVRRARRGRRRAPTAGRLRAAGVQVEDLEIGRADLEDVFLEIMQGAGHERRIEFGCRAGTLFRKEVLRFWKVSFQTVAAPVLTAVLYLLIFGHVLGQREGLRPVSYTSFWCRAW